MASALIERIDRIADTITCKMVIRRKAPAPIRMCVPLLEECKVDGQCCEGHCILQKSGIGLCEPL